MRLTLNHSFRLLLYAVILFALPSAFAAKLPAILERLQYDRDTPALFRHNELSIDLFGGYLSPDNSASKLGIPTLRRGEWGAGVGVNYYFTSKIGIGADVHFVDFDRGSFIDTMSASLLFRWPIEKFRVAPYIFAGGGRWNDGGLWTGHAGGGLEFRFRPQFGIFADARITALEGGSTYDLVRFGFRVGF